MILDRERLNQILSDEAIDEEIQRLTKAKEGTAVYAAEIGNWQNSFIETFISLTQIGCERQTEDNKIVYVKK